MRYGIGVYNKGKYLAKNEYAKELAEYYKDSIPIKLYDVLSNLDIKNYTRKL